MSLDTRVPGSDNWHLAETKTLRFISDVAYTDSLCVKSFQEHENKLVNKLHNGLITEVRHSTTVIAQGHEDDRFQNYQRNKEKKKKIWVSIFSLVR